MENGTGAINSPGVFKKTIKTVVFHFLIVFRTIISNFALDFNQFPFLVQFFCFNN